MGPSSRLGVCRGLEPSGAARPQGGAGLAMARTQSDRYKSSPGQRDCAEFADLVQIKHPSAELQWEGSFIYKLLTFHSDFPFASPFIRKLSFVLC